MSAYITALSPLYKLNVTHLKYWVIGIDVMAFQRIKPSQRCAVISVRASQIQAGERIIVTNIVEI